MYNSDYYYYYFFFNVPIEIHQNIFLSDVLDILCVCFE